MNKSLIEVLKDRLEFNKVSVELDESRNARQPMSRYNFTDLNIFADSLVSENRGKNRTLVLNAVETTSHVNQARFEMEICYSVYGYWKEKTEK